MLLLVHFKELVHVLAEVHDNGMVNTLSGQAGASGAGQNRYLVVPGYFHYCQHIVDAAGNHHAHRLHLVDAGVSAVEDARKGVKSHFPRNSAPYFLGQLFTVFASNTIGGGGHGILPLVCSEPALSILKGQAWQEWPKFVNIRRFELAYPNLGEGSTESAWGSFAAHVGGDICVCLGHDYSTPNFSSRSIAHLRK